MKCIYVTPSSHTISPSSDPSNYDPSSRYQFCCEYDDGGFSYSTQGDIEPELFGWGSTNHGQGIGAHQADLRTGKIEPRLNGADQRDLNGDKVMSLLPMYTMFGEDGYVQDYTSEIGMYCSSNLVDNPMQILNDGVDDYLCMQTGTSSYTGPCVWIKVS